MEPRRQVWLCFLRGLNVFGRSIMSMSDLERCCRKTFAESGLPLLFLDYYGPTGNVALLASGVPEEDIRRALFRAIPKPCALVGPEAIEEVERAFNSWFAPGDLPGFRWTPGVSLLCDGRAAPGDLTEPDLGVFKRLTPTVLLVYRKERVTDHGTLHSDRQGGWAAVSGRTEACLGGSWTARSFEVAKKLLSRTHWKLASGDGGHADANYPHASADR